MKWHEVMFVVVIALKLIVARLSSAGSRMISSPISRPVRIVTVFPLLANSLQGVAVVINKAFADALRKTMKMARCSAL